MRALRYRKINSPTVMLLLGGRARILISKLSGSGMPTLNQFSISLASRQDGREEVLGAI